MMPLPTLHCEHPPGSTSSCVNSLFPVNTPAMIHARLQMSTADVQALGGVDISLPREKFP